MAAQKKVLMAMVGVAGMLALTLSSCGATPEGGPGAAISDAAMVSKVADMVPEKVKSTGKLVVATDATAGVPFSSFESDNKTIVGVAPDIARAIAQTMGLEIELVNTPFDALIPGLQGNRYDMSASTMLDTAKRQNVITFVDFMKDGSAFLAKSGFDRDSLTLETICGLRVGVLRGSYEEQEISKANAEHCAADPADIKIFDTKSNNRLALENGRIDVESESTAQVVYYAKSSNGKFKQAGVPYGEALIGIGFPKDSDLVKPAQAALQELIDSGKYQEIMTANKLEDTAVPSAMINGKP
jgi:polar amino acid transport system substrate-binding protein